MMNKRERGKNLSKIRTGQRGEEIAVRHLQALGYRILERNYRCPFGEIDIVALDGDTTVFVEVKSRRTETFGDPELSVGKEKQKKISRISLHYLMQHRSAPVNARYDVVAVKLLSAGTEVRVIDNAFDLSLPDVYG